MKQALGGGSSLLRDQLQHGKQEVSEALGFFSGPLVLVDQHLQQAPRLQLGDVFQIACRRTAQRQGAVQKYSTTTTTCKLNANKESVKNIFKPLDLTFNSCISVTVKELTNMNDLNGNAPTINVSLFHWRPYKRGRQKTSWNICQSL